MEEIVWIVLGWALVLAFLFCAVVLPIWTFLRTRRIAEMRARLERLETQWQVMRDGAGLEAAAETGVEPLEEVQTEQEAVAAGAKERLARVLGLRSLVTSRGDAAAATLESWVGRRGLGWVAVVLLLLAAAFFIRHAFENRWVGELGRVGLGMLGGVVLCGVGLRYHLRGWRLFGQMFTAAGVVLLYLATYGAFAYYELIPQEHAMVFLVLLVAEAAALAALYEAPAIALTATVGALLVPLLMHSAHDPYRGLFVYLGVVNAGVAGLALRRAWSLVGSVALLGTQGLFWVWYSENYHPEKLGWAIGFQVAVFALFLAYGLAAHVLRRRKAGLEDLVRLVLGGFLFFLAAYVLLKEDYGVWMGTFAVTMATVYTALGWIVLVRRPEDGRQLLAVAATAMGFLAVAFPIQADAAWVALGWAVEGLALWWFGHRVEAGGLRVMGAVLLAVAAGRLVLVDMPGVHGEPFVPLLNQHGLPAAAVAACVLGAAAAAGRFQGRLGTLDRVAVWVAGLVGVGLVWLILSTETYAYFVVQIDQYGADRVHLHRMAQVALSVVWAVYAAMVLAAGFRLGSTAVRLTALVLFAVTLGKVVLVDMAGLSGFYRVATFLVLAVTMAAAAWAYQNRQAARLADEPEVVEHDSA